MTSGTVQTTVGAVVAGAVVAGAVVDAVAVTAVAVAGAGATEPDVTTGTGITLGFGTMITGSTTFLGCGGGRVSRGERGEEDGNGEGVGGGLICKT